MKFRLTIILIFLTVFTQISFSQTKNKLDETKKTSNRPAIMIPFKVVNQIDQQHLKVIEEILQDIPKLEDAKDRTWANAKVGEYLCKFDKDEANKLFNIAVNELIFAQNNSEFVEDDSSGKIYYGSFQRDMVIQSISECDPELALEYLYKTRPQKTSELINLYYKDPTMMRSSIKGVGWMGNEVLRETNLKADVTRRNPKRGIELIKQDLNNALTYKTIYQINDVYRTDKLVAQELADKAIDKIIRLQFFDSDNKPTLNESFPNYGIASEFLRMFGRENLNQKFKLQISDESLSKLADKISREIIQSGVIFVSNDDLQIINRFFPERSIEIEKIKIAKSNLPENLESNRYSKLIKSDQTIEILLLKAGDFSLKRQDDIYQFAACKMVKNKDYSAAQTLLKEKFSNKDYFDKHYSLIVYSNLIKSVKNKDEFSEAEKYLTQIPDPQLAIDAYAFVAEFYYRKTQTSQKSLKLLAKANEIYKSNLDKINRREASHDILSVYALIDSDLAFDMFDHQINVYDKNLKNDEAFDKYSDVKHIGQVGYFGTKSNRNSHLSVMLLGKNDFERTLSIINKNKSPYSRIILKGNLIEPYKTNFWTFGIERIQRYCDS